MADFKTRNSVLDSSAESMRRKVAQAIKQLKENDLKKFSAEWRELEKLSDRTSLQGIGADPVGIDVEGKSFEGLISVHLLFDFSKGGTSLSTSNTVSGSFSGHFQGEEPKIDSITLDMRPFEVKA